MTRLVRGVRPRSLGALRACYTVAACLAIVAESGGQTIELTEVTRFNLFNALSPTTGPDEQINPNFIGNNASAVAWSSGRLFVGGFNNTGGNSTTGIIEVLDTTATGIVSSTTVQYGPRFGSLATPFGRGYSGLAFANGPLFAAYDDGVRGQPNALVGYDVSVASAATPLWNAAGRGGAGVAMDPGYVVGGSSQGGAGVGWATFGDGVIGSSNRRALNDPTTGQAIYGFDSAGTPPVPPGFVWNDGGFPRDLSFDPVTGDLYGRVNNDVFKAVRTGPNSAATPQKIWSGASSGTDVGQNIAFMSGTVQGDLLAFNNRPDGGPQSFADAVKISDTSGAVQTATWNFLGGANPTGRGYYDFSFDPVSQTLALADASTASVSIFRFGAPPVDTRLQWAADGALAGGSGIWDDTGTTWIGDYGASAWVPSARAIFGGSQGGGSVTVASGGVSVGDGVSFSTDGYVLDGGAITLTGATASANNAFVGSGLTATVNNAITAANGMSKSGEGTLVAGGALTSGPLFVNNGTLVLAPTVSLAGTPPNIAILAPGTLDATQLPLGLGIVSEQAIGGAGTLAGKLTMFAGSTVSPGANLGTLSVTQDVIWSGGASYNWQILDAAGAAGANPGWDLLSVGGVLDISATSADPFAINLWSLSAAGPDVNGDALNFDATQGYTWTIASAAGGITGFAADAFTVNTAATNGAAGFSNDLAGGIFSVAVSGTDLNLVFSPGSGPSPTSIVIDVPSGSVTQAQAGYPTIAAATSVSKIGAGTVVFDAANAYTGPTTVSAGTLQVANADALAATTVTVDTGATLAVASGTTMKSPAVIVDGGTLSAATLAVNGSTGIASLAINAGTVAGSPAVSIGAGGQMSLVQDARVTAAVGGLAVTETSGGGRLDLGAGQVTVAAGGISATDLRADIIAGRNGGAWNGAAGIMSSAAAGAPSGTRAVGYFIAGDGTTRVSFAAPGDGDLSGQVNVFDLLGIDSAGKFGTGQPAVWSEGDFNYDGVTNVFDLLAIDTAGAYGAGNYFPAAPSTTTGLGSVAAVPEPSTGLAVGLALFGGLSAWRRVSARRGRLADCRDAAAAL